MHASWRVPVRALAPESRAEDVRRALREMAREHEACCGSEPDEEAVFWTLEVLPRAFGPEDVVYVPSTRAREAREAARLLAVALLERTKSGSRLFIRGYVRPERLDTRTLAAGTRVLDRPEPLSGEVCALAPSLFTWPGRAASLEPSLELEALDEIPLETCWLFLYDGRAPPQPMSVWNVEHESKRRLEWLLEFRLLETRHWPFETSRREHYERDRDAVHVLTLAFCLEPRQRAWYLNIETRAAALLLKSRFTSTRARMQLVRLNGYDEQVARENESRLAEWLLEQMRERLSRALERACAFLTPHIENVWTVVPIANVLVDCIEARG